MAEKLTEEILNELMFTRSIKPILDSDLFITESLSHCLNELLTEKQLKKVMLLKDQG